jgi:hypothetical protein
MSFYIDKLGFREASDLTMRRSALRSTALARAGTCGTAVPHDKVGG